MSQFEIPQNLNPMESIIKVIGVGGGGSNAVKHLYNLNVKNVDFIVCNTDLQHLNLSPIPNKIQLGRSLTKGLGAGCIPDKGREAAIESKEDIKRLLDQNTEMLFIAAGLGGGTGTGAAPVIAEVARDKDVLTVAIVTMPFKFEGKKKLEYAEKGLEELKKHVDSIIVIPNEKLKEIFPGLKMSEAFAKADDVVSNAAKSIAEIITNHLHINVDFNDVRTVMKDSGTALMGSATARGENRAMEALKNAINHPLLSDNNITGARHVLLSITTGTDDITTDEFEAITNYIHEVSGGTAEVIPGYGQDESLGDSVAITIVATGFQNHSIPEFQTKTIQEIDLTKSDDNTTPSSIDVTSESDTNLFNQTVTEAPTVGHYTIESLSTSEISEDTIQENIVVNESIQESEELLSEKEVVMEHQNTDKDDFNNKDIAAETDQLIEDIYKEPVVKIIEKPTNMQPIEEKMNTTSQSIQSSVDENINKLKELNESRRKSIIQDFSDPEKLRKMEETPAILRNQKDFEAEDKSENTLGTGYSNYTIDENGQIKPNSPYLNDQVD